MTEPLNEPVVRINGKRLTSGQTLALHSAVNSFLIELSEPDALGDDEIGRAMVIAYRARLIEIATLMHGRLSA